MRVGRSVLQAVFDRALSLVLEAGFGREIQWQRAVIGREFDESQFLREAAWVILCTGFREEIVRRKFPYVSLCFFDWESAALIVENAPVCVRSASAGLAHRRKLEAVVGVAARVVEIGFEDLRRRVRRDPTAELQQLPYVGPVTARHLAKNLGLALVKPDRHLARWASALDFETPHSLCTAVAESTGEAVPVIDLVLWRASVLGKREQVLGTVAIPTRGTGAGSPRCSAGSTAPD